MKIKKGDNSEERSILIGMIVDSSICGVISSRYRNDLFRSRYANLIAGWCAKYFDSYGKAPGRKIENLFGNWMDKSKDRETIGLVETFLGSLSDEYKQLKREINPDFILDLARKHFTQVRIERLSEQLEDDVSAGELEKASLRIQDFTQVQIGQDPAIGFPTDKERVLKCFDEAHESIIQYPGALGKFFDHWLERDGFLAFFAPEKRGKSFWLQDLAFRAMCQRRKVAYFEAGDMSENQVLRRFMVRASEHPMWPCTIKIPIGMRVRKRKKRTIGVRPIFETRKFQKGLNRKKAWKACDRLMKRTIRSREPYLRMSCHPNSTLSVKMIEAILKEWSRSGWVPDVVVIDYADIMDITSGRTEGRDLIDKQWRGLRRISQVFHCLIATATQTNRESYDASIIRRKHTSEDKRKLAHVTIAVGINQLEDEKKKGIMRVNCLALREGEYLESKCVWCLGNLKLGNPCMKSTF